MSSLKKACSTPAADASGSIAIRQPIVCFFNSVVFSGERWRQFARCLGRFVRVALTIIVLTLTFPAYAQLIQRTITIDGTFSDWTSPTNILTNTGQFSTDATGTADGDHPVQSTGRDLVKFAYTWDSTNLYLYVERAGSVSNATDWWFYIDTNADGLLQTGEKVLHVNWQGSNRATSRELCNYVASATGGDPIVSPSTGRSDGYDMPGSLGTCTAISPNLTGGGVSGLQMETLLPWSVLGFTGPSAVGFHVASSNGTNLPTQIDDNMDGPAGSNFLFFADHSIEKSIASGATVIAGINNVAGGTDLVYSLKLNNLSTTSSANIVVTDVLPVGVTYVSHNAPAGTSATYDTATRTVRWSIPTIGASSPPTTITSLTLTITVTANLVSADTTVTNTGNISSRDTSSGNNSSSVAALIRASGYTLLKSVALVSDPVNGATNPRTIPGAIVEYTILATNAGGLSDVNSVRVIDPIPLNTKMFVGDIGGVPSGPVSFIQGVTTSGLTLGAVQYSNDNGATWAYIPTAGADGCDGNVTHVRVNTTGTFASGVGVTPAPSFSVKFRVCVR